MTGMRETWRLTALLTLFLTFTQSYRLPGNSEYFGYADIEDRFSHSPSSYHSSHNPPAFDSSPAADFRSSSLPPLTFTYNLDLPATSPHPFYLVEEASSYSGWDGHSQVSLPSVVKPKISRPHPPAEMPVDEDDHPNKFSSFDSDLLGIRNMEREMQRLRSPFRKRENMRPVMEQTPFEKETEEDTGKIVVTIMSSKPRNSVPSFGRVVMKMPVHSGSSRLKENKRFNKVDYFYADGNGSKVKPPTFPPFLSKMYRFAEPAEPKPGKGWNHPETPAVGEMKGSEFYNIEQDPEEPVPADELTEAGDVREPRENEEFETEQIEQPLRDEEGENVAEVPEEHSDDHRQERMPFMEFKEPSQPTMLQEPRATVLKRPMSLSSNNDDLNKRPLSSSATTRVNANPNSNKPSGNSRSRNIEILRQKFEAVVQKYNNGLAALSRLESKDVNQPKLQPKSPEDRQPKYGRPSSRPENLQSLSQASKSPHPEKPKSNIVDLEVRPSFHVDHHQLSKSKSPLDSELLSIIQKLLKDTKLE